MAGRVRRRRWPHLVGSLLVVALFAAGLWREQQTLNEQHGRRGTDFLAAGEYAVLRVVDGDTLLLERGRTRVRLQGIDTPETVKEDAPVEPWGPEASDYTKRFVSEADGRIRLELDGETADRHGRQLAFVWHDERLLNEELVRQGLAHAKLGYDYGAAMKARLRKAEADAKANHRGIWSAGGGTGR